MCRKTARQSEIVVKSEMTEVLVHIHTCIIMLFKLKPVVFPLFNRCSV